MPLGVTHILIRHVYVASRAHIQFRILHTDVELILLSALCLTIREQCTVRGVGAEPEHQRVVVVLRAVELLVRLQLYAVLTVQFHRDADRSFPGVVSQIEV